MNKNKKGFSLIELIVVMAVMAILVLIATPRYLSYTKDAREKQIVSDIKSVSNKISEYLIRNQDEHPNSSSEIDSSIIHGYIIDKQVYGLKGILTSIDITESYVILPNTFVKRETGSKLTGQFIASMGGDVYYIDRTLDEVISETTAPIINLVASENPDEMNAIIKYSNKSITQEYKIGDGNWQAADFNLSMRLRPVLSATASSVDHVIKLSVPNGIKVYARATYPDNKTYEAESNLYKPEINLSTSDKAVTLKAVINELPNAATKEYRIGTGKWTTYTDDIIIDYNAIVYVRGKDSNGNIISYNFIEVTNLTDVIFHGLGESAFDNDINTRVPVGNNSVITWEGNLTNRAINIYLYKAGGNGTYLNVYFKDKEGNTLKFNTTAGAELSYMQAYYTGSSGSGTVSYQAIVPEDAVSITFYTTQSTETYVRDINVSKDNICPTEVTNISSVSTDTNITLNWEQSNSDYLKTLIYRDNIYVGTSTGTSFSNGPLLIGQEYKYQLQVIDINGNASKKVEHIVSTNNTYGIAFRGIDAAAFDRNTGTYANVTNSSVVTWIGDLSNQKINVYLYKAGGTDTYLRAYFRDDNGNALSFKNAAGATMSYMQAFYNGSSGSGTVSFQVIVPEGATKITFTNNNSNNSCRVRDIHIVP